MVFNTVSRSSVELIAWPTSPSAVSCPNDFVSASVRACSSLNSRTFSIAMTAWSAKVFTSSIWGAVKGFHLVSTTSDRADRQAILQDGNSQERPIGGRAGQDLSRPRVVVGIRLDILDVRWATIDESPPHCEMSSRRSRKNAVIRRSLGRRHVVDRHQME